MADNSQALETHLPSGSQVDRYIVDDVSVSADSFGIRYGALDTESGVAVQLSEFFPAEFVTRDGTAVRPVSEDARRGLSWGLRSFTDQCTGLLSVKHPGIIRILRTFEANSTVYAVSEPIIGTTLAAQLVNGRTLAADLLAPLADALLDAIAQAHAAGVIHGDIRPDNIIMREGGGPVLVNFGAARFVTRFKCRSLGSAVSSGFAPPEAYAASGRLDPAFDYYSLAATLYLAATGITPPDAQKRQRGEARLKPAGKATLAWYPNGFLDTIDWGLRLDPAARPPSPTAWRDAFAGRAAPPSNPEPDEEIVASDAAANRVAAKTAKSTVEPSTADAPIAAPKSSKGGLIGAVVAGAAVLIGAGIYFSTRQEPASNNAASTAGYEVPEVKNAVPVAAAPAQQSANVTDERLVALDHLATQLKSREAQADAVAKTAREEANKAAEAARAAQDAAERTRLQKEAEAALAREAAAREEATRIKAETDRRLREAEEARHKREQELALAQQQALLQAQLAQQQAAAQQRSAQAQPPAPPTPAAQSPAPSTAAQPTLQQSQQLAQQQTSQRIQQQAVQKPTASVVASPPTSEPAASAAAHGVPSSVAMLSDRVAPPPVTAAPVAAQHPTAPAAATAGPMSDDQLAQLVALARKNCRMAAPDLTFSGDLTYERAKTMSGAKTESSGAVTLPPMTLKDGRFQAVQITPDNCAKIIHM